MFKFKFIILSEIIFVSVTTPQWSTLINKDYSKYQLIKPALNHITFTTTVTGCKNVFCDIIKIYLTELYWRI